MTGNLIIMKNKIKSSALNLRQKAEEMIKKNIPSKTIPVFSVADSLKLMHELEVFQIELELQQEELMWAEELEKAQVEKMMTRKGEQSLLEKIHLDQLKQAEKALSVSENRYRHLFESSRDGILILDAGTGKILDVNPFLIELLGYSQAQFIDKEIWEIGFFNDIASNREKFSELQQKQYARYEDLPLETADGRKISVAFVSNVYFVNNAKVIQCNIRDISAHKRVEEELCFKNEELQKSNIAKDKFFSIIAHDLRSPFNGFLGLTQIMAEELTGKTRDEIQNMAVILRKSAFNLYSLLENLLEWSSLQRNLTTFVPETLLLLPKISESIALMKDQANMKDISISSTIPQDMKVVVDGNMFGSILRNLVSNAVKFTPKGGSIVISAKSASDNLVEVSVADSGIGMNKQMIDHLFRLDVNTKREGTAGERSTGLGLIICKDFIEKHGGSMRVESEEGKGSAFYFTIPSIKK